MASKHTTLADWRRLLARLKRKVPFSEDAEDLLQSAYVRLATYQKTTQVTQQNAFIIRTAINLGIDEKRKLRHRVEVSGLAASILQIPDRTPPADEICAARQRLEHVKSALQQLPPQTLRIFLLRRVDGLRYREISELMGITVSAVEKHVAKAALHIAQWADEHDA